eukprot:1238100-Prymnesium_polylepis.1
MFASGVYGGILADMDERMHAELTPELFAASFEDIISKVYRLEMQVVLRLEDGGKAPETILHEKPRCFFDDWDYFLHEKQPQPGHEWLCCLSWLKRGTAHVLARPETSLAGGVVHVTEALIARPFSAGVLRCALLRVGDGPWLIAGLQVRINADYLPAGPLLTWHDAEPFAAIEEDPPPEEPVEEAAP